MSTFRKVIELLEGKKKPKEVGKISVGIDTAFRTYPNGERQHVPVKNAHEIIDSNTYKLTFTGAFKHGKTVEYKLDYIDTSNTAEKHSVKIHNSKEKEKAAKALKKFS